MTLLASIVPAARTVRSAQERVSRYDWTMLGADLSQYGCAVLEKLLPKFLPRAACVRARTISPTRREQARLPKAFDEGHLSAVLVPQPMNA